MSDDSDTFASVFAISLLLCCCFPAGLVMIAQHPTWSKTTKWCICLAYCGILVVVAIMNEDEGDRGGAGRQPGVEVPSPEASTAQTVRDKKNELQRSLDQRRAERDALDTTLTQLIRDHKALSHLLRDDDADSPNARVHAKELAELESQLASCWNRRETIDSAVTKIESIIRRIERHDMLESVGFSEEELNELNQSMLELDDLIEGGRESPTEEIEIDEILQRFQ